MFNNGIFHIAHDCQVGDSVFFQITQLSRSCTVGNHVTLAGMVAVHQFCHIGRHSFVAGGSLVRKDIPPYVKAAREPLSYVGINSVGLRRRGFEADTIKSIQNIYRILFQMNLTTLKLLDTLRPKLRQPKKETKFYHLSKILKEEL